MLSFLGDVLPVAAAKNNGIYLLGTWNSPQNNSRVFAIGLES